MLDVCGTWSIVGASFLQGQVPGRKPCPVCSHWKYSTRSGVLVRYALAENMVNIFLDTIFIRVHLWNLLFV